MTDDAPTLGEVVRRLYDIVRRLDEMQRANAEREARYEQTYVRLDVFQARETADAIQVRGIEGEVHSLGKRLEQQEERRRTDRALLFTSLIAPLLVAAITAIFLARTIG